MSGITLPPGVQGVCPAVVVEEKGSNIKIWARVGPIDEATTIAEALSRVSNGGLLELGMYGEFVQVETPVHPWTSVNDLLKSVHVVHDAAALLLNTKVSLAGRRKTFPTQEFLEQSVTANSPQQPKVSSHKGAAKATPKRSNAKQWTVVISVVIVIMIVIAVVGNGASNASNKAYNAGYGVGFNSNNFVSDDQAGSYCQDLWNNLSGSALSKYGSNEGNWVGGCANGVKAAN
jgi:hypothetical protein